MAQQAEEWREKDTQFWAILQKWNIKCHKKKQEGEWPVKQKDWMGPSNINQGKSSSQSPRNFYSKSHHHPKIPGQNITYTNWFLEETFENIGEKWMMYLV